MSQKFRVTLANGEIIFGEWESVLASLVPEGAEIEAVKENEENCCEKNCYRRAKYQIGNNNKPAHESTFVCEEHKETFAYDWIADYKT